MTKRILTTEQEEFIAACEQSSSELDRWCAKNMREALKREDEQMNKEINDQLGLRGIQREVFV